MDAAWHLLLGRRQRQVHTARRLDCRTTPVAEDHRWFAQLGLVRHRSVSSCHTCVTQSHSSHDPPRESNHWLETSVRQACNIIKTCINKELKWDLGHDLAMTTAHSTYNGRSIHQMGPQILTELNKYTKFSTISTS